MRKLLIAFMAISIISITASAHEADKSIEVSMHLLTTDGVSKEVGKIKIEETKYGTIFAPNLTGLEPGVHGFHVHQNPDCGAAEKEGKQVPGLAAGGHYDPASTGYHSGPYGDGHLGDLPGLYINSEGIAKYPVLAPRIKISDIKGHSIMLHAGGDNYSDAPEKLGGGGARMSCGVVK